MASDENDPDAMASKWFKYVAVGFVLYAGAALFVTAY